MLGGGDKGMTVGEGEGTEHAVGDAGDGVDGKTVGETEGMAGLRDNGREIAEVVRDSWWGQGC